MTQHTHNGRDFDQSTHRRSKRLYDRIARYYDLLAERSERAPRLAGLRLLSPRDGDTVLEIGFGTGHGLVRLARAVGTSGAVLGIDISDRMAERAAARLAREGLSERVRLRCADAIPLPYDDGSVDAIFMSFTLELFEAAEIPVLLSECRRVLKPGGRLAVVALAKSQPPSAAVRLYEWWHAHFPQLADCRPIQVATCLEDAGFRVVQQESTTVWGLSVTIVLAA